jgi:hypothetical protein
MIRNAGRRTEDPFGAEMRMLNSSKASANKWEILMGRVSHMFGKDKESSWNVLQKVYEPVVRFYLLEAKRIVYARFFDSFVSLPHTASARDARRNAGSWNPQTAIGKLRI